MFKTGHIRQILGIVVLVVITVILVPYGYRYVAVHRIAYIEDPRTHESHIAFAAETTYWKHRIQSVGRTRAHTEFAQSVLPLSRYDQHLAAHVFGSALYAAVGISGLSDCDNKYAQGCRHTFLGEAIREYGSSLAVSKLGPVCEAESKPWNVRQCEHAIGHGLVSASGYTIPGLRTSLDNCRLVGTTTDFITGCAGGAFMEYNVRYLLREDGVEPREVTDAHMFDPCTNVSAGDRVACMFWQPEWWFSNVSKSTTTTEALLMLGTYCAKTPFGVAATRSCYRGLGYMTTWEENQDTERVARVCTLASSILQNRLACWWGTGMQLPKDEAAHYSELLCADQAGESYAYCMAHRMDMVDYDPGMKPSMRNDE